MVARRIVIIEDDEQIAQLLQTLLREEGYEVTLFSPPLAHPADIAALSPDLLMLDIVEPSGRSRWTPVNTIKAYPPTSLLPLVLCTTAQWETYEARQFLREQSIGVVLKPFDIDEVVNVVQKALMPQFSSCVA